MNSDEIEYRALKVAFRTTELERDNYRHQFERAREEWREMQDMRDHMLKKWQAVNKEADLLHEKLAAACAILQEAADYTDVAIAFRLADLARDFFKDYPETRGYLQTKGDQQSAEPKPRHDF